MKVKHIATGEIKTVSAGYGARLIENGKAVLVHETAKSEKPAESKRTSAEKAAKTKDE